jgi:hypothetical protein
MSKFVFVATLLALALVSGAAQASTSGVVVSQVYGGGGNSGATFRNDYVELFNAGASPVDLSGWTVQYATSAGTSWQATTLAGTLSAGGYYLVQLASNGASGSALPAPDATGTSNVAASSGKIALVRNANALTCGAAAGSCSAVAPVEDFVGYGAASDFEGAGSAPAPSATLADLRAGNGCTDTDENATDFTAGTASPRNTGAVAQTCGGGSASGASGSVQVDVDVASVLSVALNHSSLSFGAAAAGTTPAPLAENVTVSSNNAIGYSLAVARTAFSPRDLPLALGATAPAGATLGSQLAGGALVPVPVAPPAAALQIGSKNAATSGTGDVWPTRIGFSAALPLVPSGRYAATVTYTATAG